MRRSSYFALNPTDIRNRLGDSGGTHKLEPCLSLPHTKPQQFLLLLNLYKYNIYVCMCLDLTCEVQY